jgi:hypothetical protein
MTVQRLALRRKRAMNDFESGRLLDAEEALTEVVDELRASDAPGTGYELGRALIDRATVRRFLNRWDDAIADLDACEELAETLPPTTRSAMLPNVHSIRAKLHLTAAWQGADADAAQAALDALDAEGFSDWFVREAQAELAYREHRWAEAAEGYREVGAELGEKGWPRAVAVSALRAGTSLLELGRVDEASPLVREAQAYFAERGAPDLRADAERQLMRLLAAEGRSEEAWEHALVALSLVEESFRLFRSLFDQQRYLADKSTYYAHAFAAALASDPTRALTVAERAKSFYLTQLLASGGVSLFDGVDPVDVERLRALEEELDLLEERSAHAGEGEALETRALGVAAERDELFAAIMRDHPRWASAHAPAPFDAAQDLAQLPEGWASISYFWLGGELHVFLARASGEVVHDVTRWTDDEIAALRASGAALRALTAQAMWLDPPVVFPDGAAARLVPAAIAERLRPDEQVLVSPHGCLRGVPLQAGPLQRRAVQYIPSLALLRSARGPSRADGVLLLGCEQDGFGSPRLDGVARELEAIAAEWAIAPDAHVQRILLGPDEGLGDAAPSQDAWDAYRYVQIACHGALDPRQPLDGRLRLGSSQLRMSEVFDARLDADLVCLSACDLGQLGEEVGGVAEAGDEWVGFTMPLLSAGARAILVSLWEADDATAARLMPALHASLRDGAEPATALRDALAGVDEQNETFWSNWYLVGFPAASERSVAS